MSGLLVVVAGHLASSHPIHGKAMHSSILCGKEDLSGSEELDKNVAEGAAQGLPGLLGAPFFVAT